MGKNAFDVGRSNLYNFPPEDLIVIGWDTQDGPEHPLFDVRAKLPLDEKLVINIMALGKIISPIRVRKNGDKAEVVVGRQRVKAAREANKRLKIHGYEPIKIPAQLDRVDESGAFGIMVSENELRKDDSPLIKAKKVLKFIDLGNTEDAAAKIFGVTTNAIKMYLSLLDLDKSVQKMVEDSKLSATAAASLSSLPRDEQKAEAEKLLVQGTTTIADTKTAVRKSKARKQGGDESEIVKVPGKKILKRVLIRNTELVEEEQLNPDFIKGIRFAMGNLSPGSVKGLTAMMADEWK